MNRNRTMWTLAAVAVLSTALPLGAQSDGPDDRAEVQRAIKRQFIDLTGRMLELATLLEQTEPASARALREAVNHAQAAFIAEDMDKVVTFLQQGLSSAAARTEREVIDELRSMLRALQRGEMDLEEQSKRIAEWKEFLERINRLRDAQAELERQSDRTARADEIARRMEQLAARLAGVVADQKELLAETRKLEDADRDVRRLAELRDEIDARIARQEKLNDATENASVGALAVLSEPQDKHRAEANQLAEKIEAADDEAISKLLEEADEPKVLEQAAESVSAAAAEMKKASDALGKSDAGGAAGPQEQSLHDLRAAADALGRAIDKASASTPAGKLSKGQGELADEAGKLGDDIGDLERDADAAADGREPDASSRDVRDAAGHMQKASRELSAQDAESAADEQARALERLEKQEAELAQLRRRVEKKFAAPTDRQADEQKDLAGRTGRLGEQMTGSDEPPPGGKGVSGAAGSMDEAAGKLSAGDAAGANPDQDDALEQLDRAAEELDMAIAQEERLQQMERLRKIDAMLEEVLTAQKAISAATAEIYGKRDPNDGSYSRPQQLKLAELSAGEGRLAERIAEVRKMLSDEGTTAVFPEVLGETQVDLENVRRLLGDRDAGKLTQSVQKEIERTLQEMIDAIRKELANRRKRGGGGPGGGGGGGDGPLLPPQAELKLLLSLQRRINARTKLLDEQRTNASLVGEQLRRQHQTLSERQEKLRRMTRKLGEKLNAGRPTPAREVDHD